MPLFPSSTKDDASLLVELWETRRSFCASGVRFSSVVVCVFRPNNPDKERCKPSGPASAAGAQLERIPRGLSPLPELPSAAKVLSPGCSDPAERELVGFESLLVDCSGSCWSPASGALTICGASLDSADEETMTGRALLGMTGASGCSCDDGSGRMNGGGTCCSAALICCCPVSVIAKGKMSGATRSTIARLTRLLLWLLFRIPHRHLLLHRLSFPLLLFLEIRDLERLLRDIVRLQPRAMLSILLAAACGRRRRAATCGTACRMGRHGVKGVYDVGKKGNP